jgi:hypothetical protein
MDYLAQVLKPYIQGFLAAFGAVLEAGKTPQFMEDGNSAYPLKGGSLPPISADRVKKSRALHQKGGYS